MKTMVITAIVSLLSLSVIQSPAFAQTANDEKLYKIDLDPSEMNKLKNLARELENFDPKTVDVFKPGDKDAIEAARVAIANRISQSAQYLARLYSIATTLKSTIGVAESDAVFLKGDTSTETVFRQYNKLFQTNFNMMINALTYFTDEQVEQSDKTKAYKDPVLRSLYLCKTSACVLVIRNAAQKLINLGFELNQDISVAKLSSLKLNYNFVDPNIGKSLSQSIDLLEKSNENDNAYLWALKASLSPFVVAYTHTGEFGAQVASLFSDLKVTRFELTAKGFNSASWKKSIIKNMNAIISSRTSETSKTDTKGSINVDPDGIFNKAPNPEGKLNGDSGGSCSADSSKAMKILFATTIGRLNTVEVDGLFAKMKANGESQWVGGIDLKGSLIYSVGVNSKEARAYERRDALIQGIPVRFQMNEFGGKKIEIGLVEGMHNIYNDSNVYNTGSDNYPYRTDHIKVLTFQWDQNYTFSNFKENTLKFVDFMGKLGAFSSPIGSETGFLCFNFGTDFGWKYLDQDQIEGKHLPFDSKINGNPTGANKFSYSPNGRADNFYGQFKFGGEGQYNSKSNRWHTNLKTTFYFGGVNYNFLSEANLASNNVLRNKYDTDVSQFPARTDQWKFDNFQFDQVKRAYENANFPGQTLDDSVYFQYTQRTRPEKPLLPVEPKYETTGQTLKSRWVGLETVVDVSRSFKKYPGAVGVKAQLNTLFNQTLEGGGYKFDLAKNFNLPFTAGVYVRF